MEEEELGVYTIIDHTAICVNRSGDHCECSSVVVVVVVVIIVVVVLVSMKVELVVVVLQVI